jgi:hypothetical protein
MKQYPINYSEEYTTAPSRAQLKLIAVYLCKYELAETLAHAKYMPDTAKRASLWITRLKELEPSLAKRTDRPNYDDVLQDLINMYM